MKRWQRLLLAGALAALAGPAAADPGFDNRDLKGEYLFTVTDVHRYMPPGGTTFLVNHCVVAGSVTFDGAGTMLVNAVQRCSQTGTEAIEGAQHYAVSPDGSVLISESPGMADPAHGQIVDKGRSLLLDGTTRTIPDVLSWSGLAMKR